MQKKKQGVPWYVFVCCVDARLISPIGLGRCHLSTLINPKRTHDFKSLRLAFLLSRKYNFITTS